MQRLMFDIETLATTQNALVLSIGVVPFTLYRSGPVINAADAFLMCPDICEQLLACRDVDPKTQKWWADPRRKDAAAHWKDSQGTPVNAVVSALQLFLSNRPDPRLWACGSHFDIGIVNSLCESFGLVVPWPYNAPRDMRTIRDEFPSDGTQRPGDAKMAFSHLPFHHPWRDCEEQIWTLWECWPAMLPDAPPQPQTQPKPSTDRARDLTEEAMNTLGQCDGLIQFAGD